MGAWSHEPFGNDEANDWAYGLEGERDLRLIEETLDKVLSGDDYLDATNASEAVAAVEVIAKLLGVGTQSDAYTEKVDQWAQSVHVKPSASLLAKANRALVRINGENSELRELWEEAGSGDWENSIRTLQRAIGASD